MRQRHRDRRQWCRRSDRCSPGPRAGWPSGRWAWPGAGADRRARRRLRSGCSRESPRRPRPARRSCARGPGPRAPARARPRTPRRCRPAGWPCRPARIWLLQRRRRSGRSSRRSGRRRQALALARRPTPQTRRPAPRAGGPPRWSGLETTAARPALPGTWPWAASGLPETQGGASWGRDGGIAVWGTRMVQIGRAFARPPAAPRHVRRAARKERGW